jgi:hypothetical protein
LFILVLLTNLICAQDISFTAEAPKVIRSGEQFQLVYTLNESVDDFAPPNFGEFQYLGGPMTSSSTSIQIINGRTARSSNYTFIYYLQAPAIGKYTLAPATATFKKKNVQSNSIEIEVIGTSQNSSTGSAANSQQSDQVHVEAPGGEDIFVRLEVDKRSAYVGEGITAWVKLYTKVSISGVDQQFKGPDFVSFYKQDIELPPLTNLEREKVGNDIYNTGILKKVILFPQKSGDVVVEPFDLLVEVQKQVRRQPQSIFDDFFGSSYQRSRINLKSLTVRFNIKQLPVNQSQGFTGAVGIFSLSASTNAVSVKTNDAITFKITVSGRGNIKLIESVKTDFPPAFDVFEPMIKTNIDKNALSGTKVFEYTAIPRHAGKYTVAPFSLVYFDLTDKTYKTLSTQSFDINVEKGENDSSSIVVSNLSKEDVKLLGSDIRYIATKTRLHKKDKFIFGSKGFFSLFVVSFLIFILVLIIRKEQIKRSADMVKLRNRTAGKTASKRLKIASQIIKHGKKDEFYEELGKILWGYLSDKLNITIAELSKERALEEFKKFQIEDSLSEQFFSLAELCEYARFAPGGKETEMPDIFNKAEKLINKIDHNL